MQDVQVRYFKKKQKSSSDFSKETTKPHFYEKSPDVFKNIKILFYESQIKHSCELHSVIDHLDCKEIKPVSPVC